MSINYKHFLITRFNVRANYGCKLRDPDNNPMNRILDDDYLSMRFDIFEKYTLDSIIKQTNQNFTWLILFHKKTPLKFKKKIKELKTKYNFIDLYFDDNEKFNFKDYCTLNNENKEFYITSRVDNDDMLASSYIEKTEKYANKDLHKCVISYKMGLKYDLDTKKKYNYIRDDNHFLSMISPVDDNILNYNHAKILDSGVEVKIINTKEPMWTEIIHSSNVINKIKPTDLEKQTTE